jgi:hypothetical protein
MSKNKSQDEIKKEYLKRVNSPVYMRRLKKNVELLRYYKENFNPKVDTYIVRSVAKYFTEDLKNPIPKYIPAVEDTSDI